MCEISSLVSMFKLPENYADDTIGEIHEYVCISNKIHQHASKKSPLQMKLKTKPPNSKGWGIIIIQDITLLRQGEKSAQHKAGLKI